MSAIIRQLDLPFLYLAGDPFRKLYRDHLIANTVGNARQSGHVNASDFSKYRYRRPTSERIDLHHDQMTRRKFSVKLVESRGPSTKNRTQEFC